LPALLHEDGDLLIAPIHGRPADVHAEVSQSEVFHDLPNLHDLALGLNSDSNSVPWLLMLCAVHGYCCGAGADMMELPDRWFRARQRGRSQADSERPFRMAVHCEASPKRRIRGVGHLASAVMRYKDVSMCASLPGELAVRYELDTAEKNLDRVFLQFAFMFITRVFTFSFDTHKDLHARIHNDAEASFGTSLDDAPVFTVRSSDAIVQ
jgi:hypothetical protein